MSIGYVLILSLVFFIKHTVWASRFCDEIGFSSSFIAFIRYINEKELLHDKCLELTEMPCWKSFENNNTITVRDIIMFGCIDCKTKAQECLGALDDELCRKFAFSIHPSRRILLNQIPVPNVDDRQDFPFNFKNNMVLKYTGGVCSGIVSDIFLPPGPLVSPSLGLFASPGSILEYMERNISTYLSQIPSWISTDCHFALRKYFCGSYFLKPEKVHLSDVIGHNISLATLNSSQRNELLNWTFYVPSYPDRSVCVEYESKCQDFINRQNWPFLIPNCSKKVEIYDMYISAENRTSNSSTSVMVDVFPNISQVVSRVEIYGIMLPLSSSPNMMLDSNDEGYYPRCPGDFVVPNHPSNDMVQWVFGSACARPCRSQTWSVTEWATFDVISTVSPIIGIVFLIIFVISQYMDGYKRKQYLVFIFALTSSLGTIWFVIILLIPNRNRFCYDNAVGLSYKDGITVCAVQSFILSYAGLASCMAWCAQAVELYLRVWLKKSPNRIVTLFIILIFVFPLYVLFAMGFHLNYGYNGQQAWCSMWMIDNMDIYVFQLPVLVLVVIGFGCMIFVISHYISAIMKSYKIAPGVIGVAAEETSWSERKVPGQSSQDGSIKHSYLAFSPKKKPSFSSGSPIQNLKFLSTLLSFVTIFLAIWLSTFAYRFLFFIRGSQYDASRLEWENCVFDFYDGVSDESWSHPCHLSPALRPNIWFAYWTTFCVCGQSFLISLIFLSSASLSPTIKRLLVLYWPGKVAQHKVAKVKDSLDVVRPFVPSKDEAGSSGAPFVSNNNSANSIGLILDSSHSSSTSDFLVSVEVPRKRDNPGSTLLRIEDYPEEEEVSHV